MSINIKNPETVRLIRELAGLTGKGQTEAVAEAVRERIAKVRPGRRRGDLERIRAIMADSAKRFRPPDDTIAHGDLLYDEDGLPK